MDKVFIGWSGNQRLAKALGKIINDDKKYIAVVGGGTPTNMYLGDQVLSQINSCDTAIVLVEQKGNSISPNLMFEWGYLVSRLSVKNINTILINMKASELPSDVLGTWAPEMTIEREEGCESRDINHPSEAELELAKSIYDRFLENGNTDQTFDYFSIIANWPNYFSHIRNSDNCSERDLCTYIIFGCLAAYYYGDNEVLREALDRFQCGNELGYVSYFAKAYIDVFIKSEVMSKPLSTVDFCDLELAFESTLERKKRLSDKIEEFLDLFCYEVYGLACLLYSKNEELDDQERTEILELSKKNFDISIELLNIFEHQYVDNPHICRLLKAYIFNDVSNVYRGSDEFKAEHLKYLELSVSERKSLYETTKMLYPTNSFLINKMEQEYIIALSAKSQHIDDNASKRRTIRLIKSRLEKWKMDHDKTGSMIKRIEKNLAKAENN